ncbi:MAG: GNAT family N-acyltransferase [Betaproteobacteria bacterium]
MKELPNPLQSLSLIGEGLSTRLAGKLGEKLSEMNRFNKFSLFFPLKKGTLKKKSKKLKALKKILAENKAPSFISADKPIVSSPAIVTKKASPIHVYIAHNSDEIKEAQRLRYKVFAEEMGAKLPNEASGLDVDEFDNFCDHLIVRDLETLKVVGTYRALPPDQAKRIGRIYSDSEFDLSRINHLRPKILEIGRSCVHKDYRSGGVIMSLWAGLAQYMKKNGYEIMLGCASVPMGDGGHYAASLNRLLQEKHLCPIEYRAFPKLALPLEKLNSTLEVEPPPLVKGYLRLGAQICSEPAWDPDFNTADFLTMLRMSDIHPRYAKHFL